MHPKGVQGKVCDEISVENLTMDKKILTDRFQEKIKDPLSFHIHPQVNDPHQCHRNEKSDIGSSRTEEFVQFYVDQVSQ